MASKSKWKKRLKKIGKVAAIAGAAALAGKLASKRRSASIAGMDDAGIGVTHPALTGGDTGGNYITKKTTPNVAADIGTTGTDKFLPRVHPGTLLNRRVVNPHEATAAAGAAYRPRVRTGSGPRRFKHGGKVTGIAKRGFGRALMKGKK